MSDAKTITTYLGSPTRSQQLLAIVDRLAPLAPGPWQVQPVQDPWQDDHPIKSTTGRYVTTVHSMIDDADESGTKHADFIVHAPEDMAFLLNEVDRLDRALWALVMALDGPLTPDIPAGQTQPTHPRLAALVVFKEDMTKDDAQIMLNEMSAETGGMFDDGAAIEPTVVHQLWPTRD